MSKYARVRILVGGTVQGVGYRFFVVRAARQLDLGGWVRNLPGGEVEIVAEGQAGMIREFTEELRRGPAASRVSEVRVTPETYAAEFDAFDVRF
jgi:acylphosphatase